MNEVDLLNRAVRIFREIRNDPFVSCPDAEDIEEWLSDFRKLCEAERDMKIENPETDAC